MRASRQAMAGTGWPGGLLYSERLVTHHTASTTELYVCSGTASEYAPRDPSAHDSSVFV